MTKETPEFIKNSLKFGINLGLERMNSLLELLGNPQDELEFIHIAGTNGKGSTSMVISSILAEANIRVGLFTSPFLERFSERIRILDGKEGLEAFINDDSSGEITDDALNRLSLSVKIAVDKMLASGEEHPTEFEIVTAIAFLYFREKGAEVCVLEVGLGGRLDSTNVISNVIASGLAAIGLDHTKVLGEDIASIALEKAHIMKSDVPCFVMDPSDMILDDKSRSIVRDVLQKHSIQAHAKLSFVRRDGACPIYKWIDNKLIMEFVYKGITYRTSMIGEHQISNICLAIELIRSIKSFEISEDDIRFGVAKAFWKGRFEIIDSNPMVILDGGHNPQCIESLIRSVEQTIGDRGIRLVIAAMADKNVDRMIDILHESKINISEIIATSVRNERSMDSLSLGNKIQLVYNRTNLELIEDSHEALRVAYKRSREDGKILLVAGSLYLIGEVREEAIRLTSLKGIENARLS